MDAYNALVGKAFATQKIVSISALTGRPGIQIQYVGSKLFAKVVVAASGNMTFYADDVDGATTVDPNIGIAVATGLADATGVIDLSTPHEGTDTFGELAAHINSMADWRCYLVGVRPETGTDAALYAATYDCRTDEGVTVMLDEVTQLDFGFSITANVFTSRPSQGWATKHVGWQKEESTVENYLDYLQYTITHAATVGDVKIYSCDDLAKTSVVLYDSANYVSGTAGSLGTTPIVDTPFIKAKRGERLLVMFDAASAIQTAVSVNAIGHSVDLRGAVLPGGGYTGCV